MDTHHGSAFTRISLLIFVISNLGGFAFAEIVYLSQDRFVTADAEGFDPLSSSTQELGKFDDLVLLDEVISDDTNRFVGTINSISSQTSELADFFMRGVGRASAFGSGPEDVVSATADSAMEIVFELEENMNFVLDGQLRMTPTGQDLFGAFSMIRLTGPTGVVAEVEIAQDGVFPDNSIAVVSFKGPEAITGELTAGEYTLEVGSRGVGIGSHTRCSDFEFSLSVLNPIGVPEPSSIVLLLTGLLLIRPQRPVRR